MSEDKKKNRAAVALGRRGGKMRAAKLSAAELSSQGKKAAAKRWERLKPSTEQPGESPVVPELVTQQAASKPPEPPKMESRDSNVILALREQGYEVGEPALHPDGRWRVNVRSREFSAWVEAGEEMLDVAAGRLTLEAVLKRRHSEQRSAAAGS